MGVDRNIIEISDFANVLSPIFEKFKEHTPMTRLIFIDGFPGAGKTRLANFIRSKMGITHIEVDNFMPNDGCLHRSYVECVKQTELKHSMMGALKDNKTIVVDGICLNDIFPIDEFCAFRIYIHRVQEFKLRKGLREEIELYNRRFTPVKFANMIITNNYALGPPRAEE